MASSLLSSPSLSLSSQFSAIIIVVSDLHPFNAGSSMQLQGSVQWLTNFPEFINKFGMKSAITYPIEIGKIGFKNVSEIAITSLIGRKKSNHKCSIDQDHHSGSIKFGPPDEINQDDPEDSVGPVNYIANYNVGGFAAHNRNGDDHHHHGVNDNDHGEDDDNEDHEGEGEDDREKEGNDSGGNVQISKKMIIIVYGEEDPLEVIHTDIIVADLEDWNSLAQRIFELWRQRNDGEAREISEAINPSNCWPGYITLYTEYLPEEASFIELFEWGVDAWEDVKDRLNCLEVFPQDRNHDDSDRGKEEHEEESERSGKRQRVSDQ